MDSKKFHENLSGMGGFPVVIGTTQPGKPDKYLRMEYDLGLCERKEAQIIRNEEQFQAILGYASCFSRHTKLFVEPL